MKIMFVIAIISVLYGCDPDVDKYMRVNLCF